MKKGALNRGLDTFDWFKFFPHKWMGDLDLMACSLAAQGLWMQMVCLMFKEGVPRGVIRGDVRELARRLRRTEDEVRPLLSELEAANVFSRGKLLHERFSGAEWLSAVRKTDVICRFMVEEWRLKLVRSAAGRAGGFAKAEKDVSGKRLANAGKGLADKSKAGKDLPGISAGKPLATLSKESRVREREDLDPQTKTKNISRSARGGEPVPVGLAAVAALGASSGKTLPEFREELLGRVSSVASVVRPLSGEQVRWWSESLEALPVQALCTFAGVHLEHAELAGRGKGEPLRDPGAFLADRLLLVAREGAHVVASPPKGGVA